MSNEIKFEAAAKFFNFIKERHAIYLRRKRGDPWPWTDDPIMQTYKFTNIFRELDTGTVHCRKEIREPYADDPELFFNIASYRLYNYIDSQKAIGYVRHYNPKKVMYLMYKRQKEGYRIFTGAHMITGTLGGPKIEQVFGLCLSRLWQHRKELEPQPGDTLQQAFKRLNKHNPGYGPFIAYEVISDLRWTRYLCNAVDIMTWANPGPGCKRGLNRILGNKVRETTSADRRKYPKGDEEYLEHMRMLLESSRTFLPKWVPALEMRDVEHSLCEYDKYMRATLGEGRPRSKFVAPHLRQV